MIQPTSTQYSIKNFKFLIHKNFWKNINHRIYTSHIQEIL